MKHSCLPAAFRAAAAALDWACAAASPISANSINAGGRVPEMHNLSVTPVSGSPGAASAEVAVIEIDNNLPSFELALEFPGDGAARIAEVRLVGFDGALGGGLPDPASAPLEPDGTGRFVWRPGRQTSATLGYRMKVVVTYADPSAAAAANTEPPGMRVAMPVAY
jgi:hypothetical protein